MTKNCSMPNCKQFFQVELENRFTPLQDLAEGLRDRWHTILTNVKGAAFKTLGKRKPLKNKEWFVDECRGQINRRNDVRIKQLDNHNKFEYKYQVEKRKTKIILRRKKRDAYENKLR